MSGPLGHSFTTALANGMVFSGKITPQDARHDAIEAELAAMLERWEAPESRRA